MYDNTESTCLHILYIFIVIVTMYFLCLFIMLLFLFFCIVDNVAQGSSNKLYQFDIRVINTSASRKAQVW